MLTTGPLQSALYDVDNDNNTIVISRNISTNSNSGGNSDCVGCINGVSNNATTVSAVSDGYSTTGSTLVLLHKIQPEEVIILVIILVLWVLAVASFLRKWSHIRILQPMEPRYRHNPKNLENVLIVKRAQDSVIYKNYSRKMSVTMVAREKRRLQRMRTLPILKDLPLLSHVHEVMEASPGSPSPPSTSQGLLAPVVHVL